MLQIDFYVSAFRGHEQMAILYLLLPHSFNTDRIKVYKVKSLLNSPQSFQFVYQQQNSNVRMKQKRTE